MGRAKYAASDAPLVSAIYQGMLSYELLSTSVLVFCISGAVLPTCSRRSKAIRQFSFASLKTGSITSSSDFGGDWTADSRFAIVSCVICQRRDKIVTGKFTYGFFKRSMLEHPPDASVNPQVIPEVEEGVDSFAAGLKCAAKIAFDSTRLILFGLD